MSDFLEHQPSTVFISPAELQALRASDKPLVILDIRFQPNGTDARAAYLSGHIPEAVFVDFETELAGEPQAFSGRRPLPHVEDLNRDARRWGIRHDSQVIVYDNNKNLQAGRAWWVLRWAGIRDVRILNGGLAAWKNVKGELSNITPLPAAGDVQLTPGHMKVLNADSAQSYAKTAILLDARSANAYAGRETNSEDARWGHIPGAISVPTAENIDATGILKEADFLKQRFHQLGLTKDQEIGVYCGGGVAAAHQVAVLESIGISAALFPGSWSAWCSDPSRPVATGFEPDGDRTS
jgi:thiosulfate/3-mercaptopyruvate sulfurtransferase